MTVTEFLAWNEGNIHGRYELLRGEPVQMHAQQALHDAVRAGKLPCQVFPMG